mgnify:CR=1 FL=1
MGDGQFFVVFFLSALPGDDAVDGGKAIIDIDAKVGVETCLVIDKQGDYGHDDARNPHVDACFYFLIEIDESCDDTENFYPVIDDIIFHFSPPKTLVCISIC